jgi:hypothetical protein
LTTTGERPLFDLVEQVASNEESRTKPRIAGVFALFLSTTRNTEWVKPLACGLALRACIAMSSRDVSAPAMDTRARKMNWVSAMNRILLVPATVFALEAVCPWFYAAAADSGNAQDCDRLAASSKG